MGQRNLLLSLLMGLVLSTTAVATSLRLRPKATVEGPIVTLGDVAQIQGEDPQTAGRLARIELMPAPVPGETHWLDLRDLKDHLLRKNINVAEMDFFGPRRVEISRTGSASGGPKPDGPPDWKAVIERMLRRNIESSEEWVGRKVEIRIEAKSVLDFLRHKHPDHWEILLPDRWRLGRQIVRLEAPVAGDIARFPIQVTLSRTQPVVVARRRIHRGRKISREDLGLVYRSIQADDSRLLADIEEAVGKEATRTIERDREVTSRDIKSPPMVFRGSQVTVRIRTRTVPLDMVAVAKEDGGLGDWIEVVNPTSRKALETKVRVTGFQTAEMPANAPPSAAKLRGVKARRRTRAKR